MSRLGRVAGIVVSRRLLLPLRRDLEREGLSRNSAGAQLFLLHVVLRAKIFIVLNDRFSGHLHTCCSREQAACRPGRAGRGLRINRGTALPVPNPASTYVALRNNFARRDFAIGT